MTHELQQVRQHYYLSLLVEGSWYHSVSLQPLGNLHNCATSGQVPIDPSVDPDVAYISVATACAHASG